MILAFSTLLLAFIPAQDVEKDSSKDPDVRQMDMSYEEMPLTAILSDLQRKTGIPIEMDEDAKKAVDPDKTLVSIKVHDLSLCKSLYLMLLPHRLTVRVVDRKKVLITIKH
jgi:hypothetical protein